MAPRTYDVIGCGAVVLQYHGPVLRRLEREGLVCTARLVDLDRDRALHVARALGVDPLRAVTSHQGRLADVALVAVPPKMHVEVLRPYATAGKDALVEKPVATSLAELDGLLAIARESGSRILVGHMRRLYRSVMDARSIVSSGLLGDLRQVVVSEGGRFGWAAATAYVTEDPFGGVLFDTGSHALDSLLFILGLDSKHSLEVDVSRTQRRPLVEPAHEFQSAFSLGCSGAKVDVRLLLSRTQPLMRGIRIRGAKGALFVPPDPGARCVLTARDQRLAVEVAHTEEVVVDSPSAFYSQHRALLDPGGALANRLSVERFRNTTALLEALV